MNTIATKPYDQQKVRRNPIMDNAEYSMRSAANPDHVDPAAAKTHITRTRKELIYLYLTSSVTYQATLSIPHFSLAEQSGRIDALNSRLVSVIMNLRRKDRTSHM